MMKLKMLEHFDVLGFVAADLARLTSLIRICFARALAEPRPVY
jgi:hypothetical protein